MKKVINYKMYDTDTARKLLTTDNGFARGSYYYEIETLYKKMNGEYFLLGEGGEISKYGIIVGPQVQPGIRFIPLGIGDAKKWVAENFDGDTYTDIFGKVDE